VTNTTTWKSGLQNPAECPYPPELLRAACCGKNTDIDLAELRCTQRREPALSPDKVGSTNKWICAPERAGAARGRIGLAGRS